MYLPQYYQSFVLNQTANEIIVLFYYELASDKINFEYMFH